MAEDTKNLLDPSDRCGTSTAVRLQNVTIDPVRSPKRLDTTPVQFPFGNISWVPSEGTILRPGTVSPVWNQDWPRTIPQRFAAFATQGFAVSQIARTGPARLVTGSRWSPAA